MVPLTGRATSSNAPPEPLGPLRAIVGYARDSFFTQCARVHGDLVRLRFPRLNAYLVSPPTLIEEVLTTHQASSLIPVTVSTRSCAESFGSGSSRTTGRRGVAPANSEDRADALLDALLVHTARTDDADARDGIMTFLLAGHETTALALSWAWYRVAQHPEAERALRAELAAVLGGRPPLGPPISRSRR